MTFPHLTQAIRDAEKGGWTPQGRDPDFTHLKIVHTKYVFDAEFYKTERLTGTHQVYSVGEILMSPAFWSALWKARGWHDCGKKDCGTCASTLVSRNWMWQWHRFINHLISGGDAESFFEFISTNN